MDVPKTRYAQAADGTSLAYQVFGEGDNDFLYLNTGFSHLEIMWELPHYARFMRRLSAGHRVITFDKRGWGLSERRAPVADLETMLDDLRTVLDAADSQRTVLFGFGEMGGAPCAVHAATFPERVRAFIWWGVRASHGRPTTRGVTPRRTSRGAANSSPAGETRAEPPSSCATSASPRSRRTPACSPGSPACCRSPRQRLTRPRPRPFPPSLNAFPESH